MGTAPIQQQSDNRATTKGLLYPYYEHYSTVTEWGQHPRSRGDDDEVSDDDDDDDDDDDESAKPFTTGNIPEATKPILTVIAKCAA